VRRQSAPRKVNHHSGCTGPSRSDERLRKETVETRAFLIELEKQFERIKGARVHNAMPETDINPISFGDSVHRATINSDPDLKAALDRAEADLRAMKTLLAELAGPLSSTGCGQRFSSSA
jgi:hypothetical protein